MNGKVHGLKYSFDFCKDLYFLFYLSAFFFTSYFFISVTNIASHVDDDTLQTIGKNMIDTRRLSMNLLFAVLVSPVTHWWQIRLSQCYIQQFCAAGES